MGEPGFTVSVPDLIGFSDQIDHLGEFYSDFGENVALQSLELASVPVLSPGSGQLTGALTLFIDDFTALVEAERAAADRLGYGLSMTYDALAEVARDYQEMDRAAAGRLHGTAPSDEDRATDSAIDLEGQRSDWSQRLNGADYLDGIELTLPTMTYEGQFGRFNTALSTAGNLPATVDAVIEAFFGFSIIKSITMPLLGGWGFLWVMRDLCAAEADGFEAVSTVLDNGVTTLVGVDWIGDAANSFAEHIKLARTPIDAHVANLRTASKLFGDMRDTIDAAANDLAKLINKLISLAISTVLKPVAGADLAATFLSALSAAANAADQGIVDMVKDALGVTVGMIVTAVDALVAAVSAACTSTKSLCAEANDLQPPALSNAGVAGPAVADPEELSERPNDGTAEEPSGDGDPEGLSEQVR